MSNIEKGDLVHLFRRRVPGMGITLDRVKDVNDYAEFDLSEAFLKIFDKNHPEYFLRDVPDKMVFRWQHESSLIQDINETIIRRKPSLDEALISSFWTFNRAYSVQRRGAIVKEPKVDFCLVMWTRPPSDYGAQPSHWHKNKQLWTNTSWLKKM